MEETVDFVLISRTLQNIR